MSDILCNKHSFEINPYPKLVCPWCEIERLTAELEAENKEHIAAYQRVSAERERLREALQRIVDADFGGNGWHMIAKKALAEKDDE